MTTVLTQYRLSSPTGEFLADADSIEYLKGILSSLKSGHYTVDEVPANPDHSGQPFRRWGVLYKLEDGTILEEPDQP